MEPRIEPCRRVLVALDTPRVDTALALAGQVRDHVGGVKLGKEFFTAQGPQGVARVIAAGLPVFLDLKFHDIPNTVAGAIRAVVPLGPFMVNVHASGGPAMMAAAAKAAKEAAKQAGRDRPLVIAVTVLTSLDGTDLARVGVGGPVHVQVERLARLARESGLDGVVCSPREAAVLRAACGPGFKLVVPGIRPAWADANDQKRITTPAGAVAAGADYLVIGRAITAAADPAEAAARIAGELAAGT